MPWWGSLHCTIARARICPVGASSNSWIRVPAGGGSLVRTQSPPMERLATRDTCRMLPLRHARMVPLGEEIRGWRRVKFVVATETPKGEGTLFRPTVKWISAVFRCGARLIAELRGLNLEVRTAIRRRARGIPSRSWLCWKRSANRRLERGPRSCRGRT